MDVAVKDYGPRPFLVRQTLGRVMVRREAAAYLAARGLPGLPDFLGRLGPYSLAVRWVDATPLAASRREGIDPAFFDRVAAILDGLHDRGIAIGDLHHRDVLLGADGSAYIVDLATALVLGEHPGRIRRGLFERLRDQDRVALARMRSRFTGVDEAAAVAAVGPRAASRHARWRRVREAWDLVRGRRRGSARE